MEEVRSIGSLPCLEHVSLLNNPLSIIPDYRTKVLAQFGERASEVSPSAVRRAQGDPRDAVKSAWAVGGIYVHCSTLACCRRRSCPLRAFRFWEVHYLPRKMLPCISCPSCLG